jgi:hypothetical protein
MKTRTRLNVVYLDTKQVAELMQEVEPGRNWTTRKARAWLEREGALVLRGGRYFTTKSRLMAAFPEAFEALAR